MKQDSDKCVKRTLIISKFCPLPENTGGSIRTMNFARFFHKLGLVDIAYSGCKVGVKNGSDIFDDEYLLGNTDYPFHFLKRLMAILSGRPYPIRKYCKDANKILLSAIESKKYDYILTRYIVNSFWLFKLPLNVRRRIILDFDDLFSDSLYETMFYSTDSAYKRMLRKLNRQFLLRYQKKCLEINVSLFCSEKDRSLMAHTGNKTFVVPNIYADNIFENFDFGDGFNNNKSLLFVGLLSYTPNFEGLKWFVNSVYKEFKRKYPGARLIVVGHLGDFAEKEVKTLCNSVEGIELNVNVPDLKEYYVRSMAVVVPILSGGGTRIKILEAALASRPILSTPVGAEGLDFKDRSEIFLFKNAEEFLFIFNEICNREKYQALVKNAKAVVRKKYSNANFDDSMQRVLEEVDKAR